jgi:hypothetical protein
LLLRGVKRDLPLKQNHIVICHSNLIDELMMVQKSPMDLDWKVLNIRAHLGKLVFKILQVILLLKHP